MKISKSTLVFIGILSITMSLALIIAFLIFPLQLFGIFTKEEGVLEIVYPYLPILVFSFVNAGIRPITRALIDGSGNKQINLITALLDAIVARIGFALIFGVWLGWGYLGFWFGATLAEVVPIIIGIVFYFTGKWKIKKHKEDT